MVGQFNENKPIFVFINTFKNPFMKNILIFILMLIASATTFSQSLMVDITGLRNNDGCIRLAIFVDEEGFRAEKPAQVRIFEKKAVKSGKLTIRMDSIPAGTYGIALLDDENRNGKLDYRLIIPNEGIGFSNYVQKGIKRPHFRDFSFLLKEDVILRIPIRLTYY